MTEGQVEPTKELLRAAASRDRAERVRAREGLAQHLSSYGLAPDAARRVAEKVAKRAARRGTRGAARLLTKVEGRAREARQARERAV